MAFDINDLETWERTHFLALYYLMFYSILKGQPAASVALFLKVLQERGDVTLDTSGKHPDYKLSKDFYVKLGCYLINHAEPEIIKEAHSHLEDRIKLTLEHVSVSRYAWLQVTSQEIYSQEGHEALQHRPPTVVIQHISTLGIFMSYVMRLMEEIRKEPRFEEYAKEEKKGND